MRRIESPTKRWTNALQDLIKSCAGVAECRSDFMSDLLHLHVNLFIAADRALAESSDDLFHQEPVELTPRCRKLVDLVRAAASEGNLSDAQFAALEHQLADLGKYFAVRKEAHNAKLH